MQQKEKDILKQMATAVRFLSSDMITKAKSGHPGLPLGSSELTTTLFARHLRFSSTHPKWENRDRFILSAGHGSSLIYSLLYLTGYKDITMEDIKNFRQTNRKTAGHPESDLLEGIETSTGPLGQGITNGVGMAIASKIKQTKLGSQIINNKIYVLAGDGCLMEGISEEAISLAGTLVLNNLIIIWDNNDITIDGKASATNNVNMMARFKANNWNTFEVKDGYDFEELDSAITSAKTSPKPAFISVKTIIGKGLKEIENTSAIHSTPLTPTQRTRMAIEQNWTSPEFEIPKEILSNWREIGKKCDKEIKDWNTQTQQLNDTQRLFLDTIQTKNEPELSSTFKSIKENFIKENFGKATRLASGEILTSIIPHISNIIGGSADVGESTYAKTNSSTSITPQNFNGNFIDYGIREHAMGSIMNGLSLSGFKPYGSAFMAFSDYMKPAIRLSSIMKQGVVYVFTHDSFMIGQDGPTHQPIEQLAMLRAQPNLNLIRPADAVETAEAWEIALTTKETPTVLSLSRTNTELLRKDTDENKTSKGGYIISPSAKDTPQVMTLIGTGTEVSTAIKVQQILLKTHSINTSVISMPSQYLFEQQSDEYKDEILPSETVAVSIEAGSTFGWDKYADIKIGLDKFGASGPSEELIEKFGFTPKQIVERIIKEL